MSKAVFLDRDGTINYDYDHVFQVERIELLSGVASAIGDLRRAGYKVIIISNQSCIGRGYAQEEEVIACMNKVSDLLNIADKDAIIDHAYFAPHHPDDPNGIRKPKPDMILQAIEKFKLNPLECWMVGDRLSDPKAGFNADLDSQKCILIEPNGIDNTLPKTEIQKALEQGFRYFNDLPSTVKVILDSIDEAL